MKYKSFSSDLWAAIEQETDKCLKEARKKNSEIFAAFDADGTLWDTDVGENFFQFEIKNRLLPNLPEKPWEFYRSWKKVNPKGAYLWLAQIHQGLTETQVLEWANQALIKPLPVFPEILKLIKFLKKSQVKIFVVTASVSWAVKPAIKELGLDQACVIGVESFVEKGFISARPGPLLTYQEGKAQALLTQTQGQKPFLAAGNTLGDFHLLNSATHLALALTAAAADSELWLQEQALQRAALEKGWYRHQF